MCPDGVVLRILMSCCIGTTLCKASTYTCLEKSLLLISFNRFIKLQEK